jgi:hypothetical protein
MVPTILWGSAGSRTVVDLGGPVIPHVDVDLVFWGSGWNSAATLMNDVTNSVTTIMNSPYLSGLSQYRGVGNGQLLRTDVITSTSPASQTTISQYDAFVKANLNDGTLPITPDMDSQILYMVIPQPGTTDPREAAAGSHGQDLSDFGRFHFGWTENTNSLDDITSTFSHELIEAATDPEVNLNSAFIVPSTNNEICDGPAVNYAYRLDGVLVQSSLSQQDHAYVVYDGNAEKFALTSAKVLTLDSDQLANPANTVSVDVTSGGYIVSLNGEVAKFDSGQVSSITINTLAGDDTVNVASTISSRPVTINLGSGGTVNLCPTTQDLSNLAGTVTINGGTGSGTLNLFDQANGNNQNYTVTGSTVARSGMATVAYVGIGRVVLDTSNGVDTIGVQSTPPGTTVAINGGTGSNTLVGSTVDNTWSITGDNAGTLASATIDGPLSFTSVQNLTGGTANNTFVFSDGAAISGNLDGGAGGGALDFTAYSASVVVDLQTGTATGVGGSIANITKVSGSTGGGAGVYNILVGNGGNVLSGGNGRPNLLVAGSSASTLTGGDDGNILIGGTTLYDGDAASLLAMMDYWSSTPDDYATRVLNLLAGNGVPRLDPSTVMSNGGGNNLTGGPAMSLYFGNASDNTDYDPTSTAVFVPI